MSDFNFDLDKYLDSLTFAKIGISVSVRCCTVAINALSKALSSSKTNSLGS